MMDELMRQQYANAQTSFARRQQGNALPSTDLQAHLQEASGAQPPHAAATQQWLLNGPGQMAPRQHFNFEPAGGGAWRIYPPGRQAPGHAPQGSLPAMPSSFDQVKRLGDDLDSRFGGGGAGRRPPGLG